MGVVGVIDGDGLVLLRLGDGEDGYHDKEYGGNLFHVLFCYGYSSIQFSFSFLALSGEFLEVIDDDKSEIVALVGQHLAVGAKREGRHTVVALREIVDGGDAVFGFRIDWLSLDEERYELSVLCDDCFHLLADSLSVACRYLLKEACEVFSRESEEAYFVFKRCYVDDVAHGDVAFADGSAYSTYIIYAEVRLFSKLAA